MMIERCIVCQNAPARRYVLGLLHDDGIEEGLHVHDISLVLCDYCLPRAGAWLSTADALAKRLRQAHPY